jgi:hypothetical protein
MFSNPPKLTYVLIQGPAEEKPQCNFPDTKRCVHLSNQFNEACRAAKRVCGPRVGLGRGGGSGVWGHGHGYGALGTVSVGEKEGINGRVSCRFRVLFHMLGPPSGVCLSFLHCEHSYLTAGIVEERV